MSDSQWEKVHQPFELSYWENIGIQHYGSEAYFSKQWDDIYEWIDKPTGVAMDIGSGPRPPLKGRVEKLVVIEPLAIQYQSLATRYGRGAWWEGFDTRPQAGEIPVPSLFGQFDFVLCWNAIDHGYDWKRILDNIYSYLKDGGIAAIATDCELHSSSSHPCLGASREEFMSAIEQKFEVIKQREKYHDREVALLLRKKPSS